MHKLLQNVVLSEFLMPMQHSKPTRAFELIVQLACVSMYNSAILGFIALDVTACRTAYITTDSMSSVAITHVINRVTDHCRASFPV